MFVAELAQLRQCLVACQHMVSTKVLNYSDSQNYCNVLVFLSLCEIAHDWIRLRLRNNKIDFTPSSQLQKKPYIT